MTTQREQVLMQVESAEARGMAYSPSDAYKGYAVLAADEGLLDRPPIGKFAINERGRRELARIRVAKRG